MNSDIRFIVQQKLLEYTGSSNNKIEILPVGGGSINQAYQIKLNSHLFFCKINASSELPGLFVKESNGLKLIDQQKIIPVPGIVGVFETGQYQVLILEWIEEGIRNKKFWENFGIRLTQIHGVKAADFGLAENNYMGCTEQNNSHRNNWSEFFREQRLMPLVKKLLVQKLIVSADEKKFETIYKKLPEVFCQVQAPSLLHGDLWSGNFICTRDNEPVLIDPAVYFGHPSVDMAMTTLFGEFDPLFYEAYNYYAPFPFNYKEQWMVCNLYPLLIHLLLFGKTYLPEINKTLRYFS